ncbi:MAG: alkaline phosphatase family protein [Fervidicoccaceae archaeon]
MHLNKKLLVLILDAFSDKYLNHAPYLSKLCREYYCTTIEPIFAYEGIRAAILTGLNIRESGIWHDKVFVTAGRRDSKIRVLKPMVSIIDALSLTDYVNKALRFLVFKILREEYGTPHLIPSKYLEYFATYRHENKGIPGLFQILRKHDIRSTWVEPRLSSIEKQALKNAIGLLKKYDFVVVKLNSLDRLGHKYGPFSSNVRKRVKYLDDIVEEAINMLQSKISNFSFIIMSDHGMAPVEKTIDIERILEKETRIKLLRDYIPYIGSTFASFYIFNKKAEAIINELLQRIGEYGKIVSEEEELLGINRELYGHIIFTLNEKIIFYPNFFQKREIPKGMHGYIYTTFDSPIFISNNSAFRLDRNLKYTDVFGFIFSYFTESYGKIPN